MRVVEPRGVEPLTCDQATDRLSRRSGDDARQGMDENVELEIGAGLPERSQRLGIERLPLQLGRDHHAGKSKLDSATLELGWTRLRIERRHMGKPDEAARIVALGLPHAIVDQATDGEVRLIEAAAAG